MRSLNRRKWFVGLFALWLVGAKALSWGTVESRSDGKTGEAKLTRAQPLCVSPANLDKTDSAICNL